MQGGRQEGRHPERISNEYETNFEHIPNAPRPTMRAPVSTCSAVQYRTTCRPACMQGGRQEGRHPERISNESQTNSEIIPNAPRPTMRAPVSGPYLHVVQYTNTVPYDLQGGRQSGRHPERISNESRTYLERLPSDNEGSRIYMHAGRQAGRQASRTHRERISNESRTHPVRQ